LNQFSADNLIDFSELAQPAFKRTQVALNRQNPRYQAGPVKFGEACRVCGGGQSEINRTYQ
jgi:hypothetical protein